MFISVFVHVQCIDEAECNWEDLLTRDWFPHCPYLADTVTMHQWLQWWQWLWIGLDDEKSSLKMEAPLNLIVISCWQSHHASVTAVMIMIMNRLGLGMKIITSYNLNKGCYELSLSLLTHSSPYISAAMIMVMNRLGLAMKINTSYNLNLGF